MSAIICKISNSFFFPHLLRYYRSRFAIHFFDTQSGTSTLFPISPFYAISSKDVNGGWLTASFPQILLLWHHVTFVQQRELLVVSPKSSHSHHLHTGAGVSQAPGKNSLLHSVDCRGIEYLRRSGIKIFHPPLQFIPSAGPDYRFTSVLALRLVVKQACIFKSAAVAGCTFPCVCVSSGLLLPSMTFSFFCTNVRQQQQLLRPSLLRPEVETSRLSSFKAVVLAVPAFCSCCSSSCPPAFLQAALTDFSVCLRKSQDFSMESGIDPGQDYYAQDYYNYDQGWACSSLSTSPFNSLPLIPDTRLYCFI